MLWDRAAPTAHPCAALPPPSASVLITSGGHFTSPPTDQSPIKQTARRSTGVKAPPSLAKAAARRVPKAKGAGRAAVKRRYRPGTVALRDIRKFQRSGELLISNFPCQRFVRETAKAYTNVPRIQASAVLALQEAVEAYLVGLLQAAQLCSIHDKCVTVMEKDIQLAARIRGERAQLCYMGMCLRWVHHIR